MRALIQRVSSAAVEINAEQVGSIEKGLLVFLGIEKNDEEADAEKLLDKILAYRVFSDAENKMNLSVRDVSGLLLIIQVKSRCWLGEYPDCTCLFLLTELPIQLIFGMKYGSSPD